MLIAPEEVQCDAELNISDGNLNLNTRLNSDRSDLLNHFRRAVEIDHTLVHAQFKPVPGVGTCRTNGSFSTTHSKI